MNLRARAPSLLLTLWMLAAALIYFRQFAAPAIRLLARVTGHH